MSAAGVEFLRLTGEPCPQGEQPCRFSFRCVVENRGRHPKLEPVMCSNLLIANAPHGIKRDPKGENGGRPQWDWNGDRENPTLSPSIDCSKHCGWHGYIESGRCVDKQRNDEPEAPAR